MHYKIVLFLQKKKKLIYSDARGPLYAVLPLHMQRDFPDLNPFPTVLQDITYRCARACPHKIAKSERYSDTYKLTGLHSRQIIPLQLTVN